jgi:glycosyltransferase involved in cell wall biosynthesis
VRPDLDSSAGGTIGEVAPRRARGDRPHALYLLAHTPFPPLSGGSRRAANIAAALGDLFDLTTLAVDDRNVAVAGWEDASSRFMARRHSRVALALDAIEGMAKGQHVLLVRSTHAGMPALVEEWLRAIRPELVVLGRPLLTPYMRAARKAGARVVVDADESLLKVAWSVARSPHASPRSRIRFAMEALTVVGRMEHRSYPLADQLWVSSEHEKRSLTRAVNSARVFVVPNAVTMPPEPPLASEVRAIGFLGWYGYPPNEAAALELMRSILPAIRAAGGPHRLVLIGSDPTPAMFRLAARTDDVTITGQVADVVPALLAAGLLVVPLRAGGGTRVKVLEAAAAGVPVVSTLLGVEGLGMVPGHHFLVANTAAEFARQVVHVVNDDAKRAALVSASYELVRDAYSPDSVRSSITGALAKLGVGTA